MASKACERACEIRSWWTQLRQHSVTNRKYNRRSKAPLPWEEPDSWRFVGVVGKSLQMPFLCILPFIGSYSVESRYLAPLSDRICLKFTVVKLQDGHLLLWTMPSDWNLTQIWLIRVDWLPLVWKSRWEPSSVTNTWGPNCCSQLATRCFSPFDPAEEAKDALQTFALGSGPVTTSSKSIYRAGTRLWYNRANHVSLF